MRFITSNVFTLLIFYVPVNFSIAKSVKAVTCNNIMEEFSFIEIVIFHEETCSKLLQCSYLSFIYLT